MVARAGRERRKDCIVVNSQCRVNGEPLCPARDESSRYCTTYAPTTIRSIELT